MPLFIQNKDNEAYCSKTCMALDCSSVVKSLPIHVTAYRPSFELPNVSPPRHTPRQRFQRRREARSHTVDSLSKGTASNKARFHNEELEESRSSSLVASSQWTGRDSRGILLWTHSVCPGLDEECASPIDTASMSDLDKFLLRPPPFPLTVQNLAPPFVTIPPRHALLNHTSSHYPSLPEDPTAPSTSHDDTSLLTPATDSVITPSGLPQTEHMPSPCPPRLSALINTVCSWIVGPSRVLRASPHGSPHSLSADNCPAVHSNETASCYASPYSDKFVAEAPFSAPDNLLRITASGDSETY